MTINERIRHLRKDHLKLNQTEFAKLIGMKQTSVSTFEQIGASVTEQTIKGICNAVKGLNGDWLRDGRGEMFVEPDTFSLDEFMKERGASELELLAIKAYFELPSETRRDLIDHFKTRISDPVKGAEEEYIKSRFGSVQKMGQSVSSIIDDERTATNES